jgi:histidine triad (HIT) family protein
MDCLFCKIVAGSIPAKKVYEDEHSLAFLDINPQAPVHMLIIPKKHIAGLSDLRGHDEEKLLLGHLHAVASDLAREHKLEKGYRTVINTGADAGQTVFHIHVHLLGGRAMHWPPG